MPHSIKHLKKEIKELEQSINNSNTPHPDKEQKHAMKEEKEKLAHLKNLLKRLSLKGRLKAGGHRLAGKFGKGKHKKHGRPRLDDETPVFTGDTLRPGDRTWDLRV